MSARPSSRPALTSDMERSLSLARIARNLEREDIARVTDGLAKRVNEILEERARHRHSSSPTTDAELLHAALAYVFTNERHVRIVKRCTCCRRPITRADWDELVFVGRSEDDVECLELRNCGCGSTIAMRVEGGLVVQEPEEITP